MPTSQFVRTLVSARLAADVLDVPTILVARTDALSATLLTSDVDERDHAFLTGERTPEGFFRVDPGIEAPIARALAYAPYADLLWCETSTPDLDEAAQFADAVHAQYPGKLLAYNCSPSAIRPSSCCWTQRSCCFQPSASPIRYAAGRAAGCRGRRSRWRPGCVGSARRRGGGRPRTGGIEDFRAQVVLGAGEGLAEPGRRPPGRGPRRRERRSGTAGARSSPTCRPDGRRARGGWRAAKPQAPSSGTSVSRTAATWRRGRGLTACRPRRAPSRGTSCTSRPRPPRGPAPGGRRRARGTAWWSRRARRAPASSGRSPA